MDGWNYWASNRISRRTALRGAGAAGLGLAGAALIGCGDDEPEATATGTAPPSGGTSTPAPTGTQPPAAGEPRFGGQIARSGTTNRTGFNPVKNWQDANYGVGIHVYDRMLSSRFNDDLHVLEAAESIELPDDLTVIYTLKEGLVYQDRAPVNGRAVESEDVVVAQDYAREEPAAQDASFIRIYQESVETPDDRTVIYHLTQPSAYLFAGTQLGHAVSQCLIPRELVSMGPDFDLHEPIGSGPYQLKDYTMEVRYEYERNPTYREAPLPYVDSHVYLGIGGDVTAIEAAFRAKQINAWNYPTSDISERIIADLGDEIVAEEFLAIAQHTRNMSNARPVFQDIRVREAFYRWFEPQPYIDLAANGAAVKCNGMLAEGLAAYRMQPEETAEFLRYDPEAARQLLDAAGFDFNHTYELTAITGAFNESTLQVFEQQIAEVGITNVAYKVAPFSEWGPGITKTGDYDFNLVTYAALDTPHTPLRLMHTEANNINDSWSLDDPEINAMIEETERITDQEEQVAKVKELQLLMFSKYQNATQCITQVNTALRYAEIQNWNEGSSEQVYPIHTHYQIGAWIDA
jgi:peptide/nickel transport system substrate-binding protein